MPADVILACFEACLGRFDSQKAEQVSPFVTQKVYFYKCARISRRSKTHGFVLILCAGLGYLDILYVSRMIGRAKNARKCATVTREAAKGQGTDWV